LAEWWGLGRRWDATNAERWRELSPALNAQRIKAPLLINVADSEVLPTLMLWNSLKELNKPVEMFVYAGEGHMKHQPRHRYEIYERNLDWFSFWLQGKENPDPVKRQQYERWRAMRDAAKKEQTIPSSPR
jgi:dipeptidyl aminopeptidase/acylaminoacyl peptidase